MDYFSSNEKTKHTADSDTTIKSDDIDSEVIENAHHTQFHKIQNVPNMKVDQTLANRRSQCQNHQHGQYYQSNGLVNRPTRQSYRLLETINRRLQKRITDHERENQEMFEELAETRRAKHSAEGQTGFLEKLIEDISKKLDDTKEKLKKMEVVRKWEDANGNKHNLKIEEMYKAFEMMKQSKRLTEFSLEKKENECAALEKRAQSLEMKHGALMRSLDEERETVHRKMMEMGAKNDTMSRELRAANGRVQKLQKTLVEQEASIREAQEAALHANEDAGWAPDADSAIRDALDLLEGLTRSFSKSNAVASASGHVLRTSFSKSNVEEVAIIQGEGWPALEAPKFDRIAPWMLLSTSLNHFVGKEILEKQFYFMDEFACNVLNIVGSAANSLYKLFKAMQYLHGEESKHVHAARSELLRLLNPQDTKIAPDGIHDFKQAISHAKSASYQLLVKRFLEQVGGLRNDNESTQRQEQLFAILKRAGQISTRLSTQRSGIQCKGLSELPLTFSNNVEDLEAHGFHNKDLEANQNELDGKPILLVTQPAIVAIRKSDGSNYGTRRVLKKPIVRMG